MQIENVIFDLDGTLLDTTQGIIESVRYAINKMKWPELPYNNLLCFVGPPIQDSFKHYYNCDIATAQIAANHFRQYYKEHALYKAVPYEGISDTLEMLKKMNVKMAVATYKREDFALKILRRFGFDKYCLVMHGSDGDNVLTKADIINICIDELGGKKDKTTLVGDTKFDAIGAFDAGVSFVGVTYGFGFNERNDVMQYDNIGVANKTKDIETIIEEINK